MVCKRAHGVYRRANVCLPVLGRQAEASDPAPSLVGGWEAHILGFLLHSRISLERGKYSHTILILISGMIVLGCGILAFLDLPLPYLICAICFFLVLSEEFLTGFKCSPAWADVAHLKRSGQDIYI